MKKRRYGETKTQVLISGLVFAGIILILFKLLFLPFFATEERPYADYSKDSAIGTKHSVNLVFIKSISPDEYTINPNETNKNILYYYGFDKDYNVALLAIDKKDKTFMEGRLNDKNSKNQEYYGTIINPPIATGYITENGADHYDMFDTDNNYGAQEFSAETSENLLTIDEMLNNYSVLKIDLADKGKETIRTGLGAGAYALILAVILFIAAIIISLKAKKEGNAHDSDTYYIID